MDKRVRLLGTTQDAVARSAAGPVRRGFAVGTSGVVWSAEEALFATWSFKGVSFELTRQELRTAGGVRPVSQIAAVALVREPEKPGRRGVMVRTPDSTPPRLVLVTEHDWSVDEAAMTSAEQLHADSEWARQLARDLATWLNVPCEDA